MGYYQKSKYNKPQFNNMIARKAKRLGVSFSAALRIHYQQVIKNYKHDQRVELTSR